MKFARFFIDRPIFASVLAIVTVIVGVLAFITLPVAQYPEIAPPTIVVRANYPGANARTVAETTATPIEQQINGVENMLYMSSQSTADGQLVITVTFKLGTNLDIAQVQVQNRVQIAQPTLPEEVRRLGVTVQKQSPDILVVPCLIATDPTADALYISNFALLQVKDELARLPGVGDVRVFGARDYAMRVWLDPQQCAQRSLTAGDVVDAIREQNIQVAAGVVGAPPVGPGVDFQLTVNAQGRLISEDQFRQIVIKRGDNGQVVQLKDVARVKLEAQDYSVTALYNGKPAVAMPCFQLPGTNALATADAIKAKMDELKAKDNWPKNVDYQIGYDATLFVRESIKDVYKTLFEAIALVVIVVVVFLQTWRASIIPLLAIPVSLIGTFAVMKIFGFSLNNLTLFGLVLAIGIVVDDAIVVVENVQQWIERGLSPRDATYKAMQEVTGAVIAVAAGLSAVFIPTAFISGISGQFYRQFALTISVSTLISAFNSLTLSPAMAALILRPHEGKKDIGERALKFSLGWFFRLFNFGLSKTTSGYSGTVRRLVRLPALVMLVYGGLLALTYFGFVNVPTGFIPSQDGGYLLANAQLPDGASIGRTLAVIKQMEETARKNPHVDHTFAIAGFSALSGTNQSNVAAMYVVLKPFEERVKDKNAGGFSVLGQLQGEFGKIQEAVALVFPPPPVRGIGTAGGFKMIVQDRGAQGLGALQSSTDQLINVARSNPSLQNLFTSFRSSVPQIFLKIDYERAKSQGVLITDLLETLQVYLGSLYVNDFNYLGRTYRVTAQADSKYRTNPPDILQFKTRNASGQMVPLGALTRIEQTSGPDKILRFNLYPAAEINGAAIRGVSSSQATSTMEKLFEENIASQGMDYQWTELAFQEKSAGNTAILIFPLCVLFVFLVHSAEYESWALPMAIILIVPMCLLCAIAGIWLSNMDNNIFTQIGFVVLAGLSAKNAVLIVEFAKQQEEKGLSPRDAAVEACRLRLRPILMTSFAFILGVLPLMLAKGAGAEMRHALGTAVFYGMLGVTFFGLLMTPVFYVVLRWISGNKPFAHKE